MCMCFVLVSVSVCVCLCVCTGAKAFPNLLHIYFAVLATFDSPYFGYSTFSIRFCHRNFTRYVNLYFGKYIKITFDRKYRNDSYRGFVAGYISYSEYDI